VVAGGPGDLLVETMEREGRRIKVIIEETIITCGHVGDVEDARLKLCNSRDNDDNEDED
jgi:hypothetical protein